MKYTQNRFGVVFFLSIVVFFLQSIFFSARADERVALVLGNANYEAVTRLQNTEEDAGVIAAALRKVGFTVTEKNNLTKPEFEKVLKSFGRQADHADFAFVYYAGHGIEVDGVNYLIPIDARLENKRDIPLETVSLDTLESYLEGTHKVKIVVLDACRNNPFKINFGAGVRAVGSRGLAPISEPPNGTIIAYAAQEGATATDGGIFARSLAAELVAPGAELQLIFRRTRDDVMNATKNQQMPTLYFATNSEDIFFTQKIVEPPPAPKLPSPPPPVDPKEIEQAYWESVVSLGDLSAYKSYMLRYPHGLHLKQALEKVAFIQKQIDESAKPQQPVPPEVISVDQKAVETSLWKSISESADGRLFHLYLTKYPQGKYVREARTKLATLARQQEEELKNRKPVKPQVITVDPRVVELAAWDAVKGSQEVSLFQSYLDIYPAGTFSVQARKQIETLKRSAKLAEELRRPHAPKFSDEVQRIVDLAYAAETTAKQNALLATEAQAKAQTAAEEAVQITQKMKQAGKYRFSNKRDGWEYAGDCLCDNTVMCGNGVMKWSGDVSYAGEWKNGAREGAGVYKFADGTRYEGQSQNSIISGTGIYYGGTDKDFVSEAGQFNDTNLEGYGVVYRKDGAVLVGKWKNNQLNGFGAELDAKGNVRHQGLYMSGTLKIDMTPQ